MARRSKSRKPNPLKTGLLSAYRAGHAEFEDAVEAALAENRLTLNALRPVLRDADIDTVALCLDGAYTIAGSRGYPGKTGDGREILIRTDVFAFTVTGPAEVIAAATQERAQDVAAIFRKAGLFKTEADVVFLGVPYDLRDIAAISPQDLRDMSVAFVQARQDGHINVPTPASSSGIWGSGDVSRTFLGIYLREYNPQEDSDLFSGNYEARSDLADREAAYADEVGKVFGDLCDVTFPACFADGLSDAVESALDLLDEQVDASFFSDFPRKSVANGVTTWTFTNPSGVRMCFDVPELLGAIADMSVGEWVLEHPAFMADAGDDEEWMPDAEDLMDMLDEQDEAGHAAPDNLLTFPVKRP